jgi:hypothetical protein
MSKVMSTPKVLLRTVRVGDVWVTLSVSCNVVLTTLLSRSDEELSYIFDGGGKEVRMEHKLSIIYDWNACSTLNSKER